MYVYDLLNTNVYQIKRYKSNFILCIPRLLIYVILFKIINSVTAFMQIFLARFPVCCVTKIQLPNGHDKEPVHSQDKA